MSRSMENIALSFQLRKTSTEIKKKDGTVKVFFLTALSEMHDYDAFNKEVFPKEGERYFIAKPIENEEILKRINTVIANTN
jgi:CheY-like chemotaxis protein